MTVYVIHYTEDHEIHGHMGIFTTVEKAKAYLPEVDWTEPPPGLHSPSWLFQCLFEGAFCTIEAEELDPEPETEEFYDDQG